MLRLRSASRALLVAIACYVTCPSLAHGYTVVLRWDGVTDRAVAGYRLYVRENGGAFGAARDLGLPQADDDGHLSTAVAGLSAETTYAFALSAYSGGGSESERSNERTIGYRDVAAVVDTDHDGLADAQEDGNLNQVRDAGETDRRAADSDGDLVPDGVETGYGTSPLDGSAPGCAPLDFDDWRLGRTGAAQVVHDPALNDLVLLTPSGGRNPLRYRASYPVRGNADLTRPLLTTRIRDGNAFRIELWVRSTDGVRYMLRYDGNGGSERLAGRRLRIPLGTHFTDAAYTLVGRDVGADLARIDPTAVLDAITRVRVRGDFALAQLRTCR